MKFLPGPGGIRLRLELDEAQLLDQLVAQLIDLLLSHSGTALDPDPLFASLEVGGSEELPADPALARLFPDAYEVGDHDTPESAAAQFRRVTEQGLLNRKLQDAMSVTSDLGVTRGEDGPPRQADGGAATDPTVEVAITATSLPVWVRTLTALRLAIAARVGIAEESDHARLVLDEDTRGTVLVYDWLAAILDSMLRMVPVITGAQGPPRPGDADEDPSNGSD